MADLTQLLADSETTALALHSVLASLDAVDWDRPTSSPGWTVRHQVRHLVHGDELAVLAATDPDRFATVLADLLEDLEAVSAAVTIPFTEPADELRERWLRGAAAVRDELASGPSDRSITWITGPMSRASFLTARVMETFAHGNDIAEATGRPFEDGAALPHVAHLGVRTRGFAFTNSGQPAPDTDARVELTDPAVAFGPPDAPDRVTGPARDFCLLVTRRRHRSDTALTASGPHAEAWLAIAQCFAGPPSPGPPPGGW
jgi:uncharacterized protein (TIGR03084 family)